MAQRESSDGDQGRAQAGPARAGRPQKLGVVFSAVGVALLAFSLYRATLLPGLDFGDTASFQVAVGSSIITPRDGYPLYFALGGLFLWATGTEPAHALNLASAVEAGIACALVVLVATELSGSLAASIAAALLFAVSYTFWSQAIIAEVYALHLLLVGLTVWLVLRWSNRATLGRLSLFFAVYALGFGNHLSMVLLLPGFGLFLLLSEPRGWRAMLQPRVVAIAIACALAGAFQYVWNIRSLWMLPDPPHGIVEALQQFWFDVTKSDWRETMVMRVPRAMLGKHVAMYWFDLRQQFGWVGPLLACVGVVQLVRTHWRRAVLMVILYLANALFAFSYNVGDTHVFYLPSHLMIALLAAPGVALLGSLVRQPRVAAACLAAYASLRAWDDYPALDRSRDMRPTTVLAGLTTGLDDRHAILLSDLNWQVQNGLTYFAKRTAPAVAFTGMPAVVLYAPTLVADNAAIGRDVVLTELANRTLASAYGPLLPTERDVRDDALSLATATAALPPGTRYVMCLLKPTRDQQLDWTDIGLALASLSSGRAVHVPDGDYVAIAGIQGEAPALVFGSNAPFRRSLAIDGTTVSIRMESWLAADTIRRMGFGHVVVAHRHTLIVERGASFTAFDRFGVPIRTAYAANIFAPQPRYIVRR